MSRIEHVLVVTGPSGAGKSTFLARLYAGELPEEIAACLPRAEKWRHLERGEHSRWLPELENLSNHATITGVVLHYKLTRMNYRSDPALKVLRMARKVTVVNLMPPVERLVSQLSHREAKARLKQLQNLTWKTNRLAWTAIPRIAGLVPRSLADPLLRVPFIARAWSAVKESRRKNPLRKLKRYNESGYLDNVYRSWQSYLQSLPKERAYIEQIFVEPDPEAEPGKIFKWRKIPAPKLLDDGDLSPQPYPAGTGKR